MQTQTHYVTVNEEALRAALAAQFDEEWPDGSVYFSREEYVEDGVRDVLARAADL